jgi:hypothetical protein
LRILVVGSLLAGSSGHGVALAAKETGPVTVHVAITDVQGNPIAGLTTTDIEVWGDGEPVQVRRVGPAQPLSLVVLLDVTSSMSSVMVPFVWDGTYEGGRLKVSGTRAPDRPVDLFLKPIQEGLLAARVATDRVRFGTITAEPRFSPGFRTDRATLLADARELLRVPDSERYGPSPIWDAVGHAVTSLESEPGQRAVLLVTDGYSTGNHLSLRDVINQAVRVGVSVLVIHEWPRFSGRGGRIADSTVNPWMIISNPFGNPPNVTLRQLAAGTGGFYFVDGYRQDQPDLGELLKRTVDLLHRTYAITFESGYHLASGRRPDVRLSSDGLVRSQGIDNQKPPVSGLLGIVSGVPQLESSEPKSDRPHRH